MIKYGRSQNRDYILVVSGKSDYDREKIRSVINQYVQDFKMRSQTINEDLWEIVFELHLDEKLDPVLDNLLKDLREDKSISNISLLSPQLALPL